MKAVGTGAVLSAFGGAAAAQEDTPEDEPPAEEPGDDGADDDEGDDDTDAGTVHRVETRVSGPPTNPERPADFFFQPTGLHVQPGDVVKFVFVTPDHNVVSMHPAFGMRRRVPTGVDAFSSPLKGWAPGSVPGDRIEPYPEPGEGGEGEEGSENGDDENGEDGSEDAQGDDGSDDGDGPVPDTWLYAFETPGVYDLLCSPHEGFGMAMRVVVGDETDPAFETEDPSALPAPRAGPVGLARLTLTDPALAPSNIVAEAQVPWEALDANRMPSDGEESAADDGDTDDEDDDGDDDGTEDEDGMEGEDGTAAPENGGG